MGSALNPINSSLIATALTPIAHAMGVSVGNTAVLVAALYLASAIAQPTAASWPRSSVPAGSSWPAPSSCSPAASWVPWARI
ncbi:hypothetical protein ACFQX6_16620 [Streptosporangium lutulentum]